MKQREDTVLQEVRKSHSPLSNIIVLLQLIFGALPVLAMMWGINSIMVGSASPKELLLIGGCLLLFAVLRGVFYGLSIWRAHHFAYDALTKLRMRLVDHLQKLPLSFFGERKVGDLVNIIHHDVEQIELYLAHGLPEILSATLFPFLLWGTVLLLDWRLGLSLVALLPAAIFLQVLFKRLWKKSFLHFSESTRKMLEDLLEYVATIPVIKAFSSEENRTEKVLGGMQDYIKWVKRSMLNVALPMSAISMLLEGGIVVMTIVGLILLSEGGLSATRFILALILGGLFSSSFGKLATFQHIQIVYRQSLKRIQSIAEAPTREVEEQSIDHNNTEIRFDKVSFVYPQKQEAALKEVSLLFPQGSHTAIVGESGSGKTTLAALLLGFWQPSSGRIVLGGKELSSFSEKNIASLFAIVQQDVFLFNASIKENIRLGKPSATHDEIEEAARKARIHDFIMTLPKGYDNYVGEAGAKLSGGEKQRISIARMLLKDAPIVILDEATAALDSENEQIIHEALQELQCGKTVITIAHRLNTIQTMDRIVVMNKGKVEGFGSHASLMGSCSIYREMVETQQRVSEWQLKENKL